MGINFILPLIAGIVMTVMLGTQIAPSLVENMKIAKVENRTISNQNLIKDAIVRYIKIEKKVPIDLKELKDYKILKDYHESNVFDGGYSFTIDKENFILKIFTTINDTKAEKYFSNSFKFPNKPTCFQLNVDGVSCDIWETFYLLAEDIFPPKVGSKRDILDKFTKDNIGKKKDKDGEEVVFEVDDKDYVVDIPKNEVTEYVYDEVNGWEEGTTIENIGGFGTETKVFVSDSRVHCENTTLLGQEVFVVNENTGKGEIIWVAPDDVSEIQGKIFDEEFKPNNICTSKVTDMEDLFYVAYNFNQPLNRWDVSNVTNMAYVFQQATNFNGDISSWNVSNVTNMHGMFESATSFNQDIGGWNVSNVTSMNGIFESAYNFDQALNSWVVSNVYNMEGLFAYATNFNQALDNWDVSKVTNMSYMFNSASSFNQDISSWNVSNVTTMEIMFIGATSFNQDISNWNVSNVTNMNGMFKSATSFNNGGQPLDWGESVSNVTNMNDMFDYAKEFNQDISSWKVSNVTSMWGMFWGAKKFNQPLNNWDVSNVTNMKGIFESATSFNQDISNWNVSSVTNMSMMFSNAIAFNQDLSGWCVPRSEPNSFNYNTPAWTEPKPIWGNCP